MKNFLQSSFPVHERSLQSAENRRKSATDSAYAYDSDFESSSVNLKENKPDGANPNSNDIDYYVRKNKGKIRWFSAD